MEAILKLISANLWGKKKKKTLPATEISEAPDQINICPGLSLEGTYFFKDEGISLHIRDLKMRLFLLKIRIFLKIRNIF